MSNTHLNISMIAKEVLLQLKNQLVFAKNANMQYSDEFEKKGAKIGNTINIRKPQRFEVKTGAALQLQNTQDQTVALQLTERKHVAFQFSSEELKLNVEEFSKRYCVPAASTLANDVDQSGLAMARFNVYNSVGTPGTAPATPAAALKLALQAGQKLNENGAPKKGKRTAIMSPASEVEFVSGLSGMFNSQEKLSSQYESGYMGRAAGLDWAMDQNVALHKTGKMGGAPAVKTTITLQDQSSVVIDGATQNISGFYKKGDSITIEGVYAVNPVTGLSTGSLQQLVVTEDVNTDGSGEATINFLPALRTEGAYKNVSALPIDGGLLKAYGHASSYADKDTPCNLIYTPDAFVFGCADLDLPGGVDMAARATDPDSGLTVRIVRQYDINTDLWPCRVDILYGWKAVYPELACRLHI